MNNSMETFHSPNKKDYEVIFDYSVLEGPESPTNKLYQECPGSMLFSCWNLKKHDATMFNKDGFKSFDVYKHPLHKVVSQHNRLHAQTMNMSFHIYLLTIEIVFLKFFKLKVCMFFRE